MVSVNWLNSSLSRVASGADMEKAERSWYDTILDTTVSIWGFESFTLDNV